jgi:hypothetical protein
MQGIIGAVSPEHPHYLLTYSIRSWSLDQRRMTIFLPSVSRDSSSSTSNDTIRRKHHASTLLSGLGFQERV